MKDLACSDCVVSVFLSITTNGAAKEEVSPQEITALSALADVGLVPPLRFAQ